MHAEVVARLDQRHSPEQIAKQLIVDFPHDPGMPVLQKTIYKALYVQSRGELRRELTRRLRSGRTLRKPRKPLSSARNASPDGDDR